jgi:hypothetical protein
MLKGFNNGTKEVLVTLECKFTSFFVGRDKLLLLCLYSFGISSLGKFYFNIQNFRSL